MSNWTKKKPTVPGAYYVRGFRLGEEDSRPALVEVEVDKYETGTLVCNLHECNSNDDPYEWTFVEEISEGFEWLGPLSAPLSPAHIEDGEEVEVVGHLLLCAPFSSEELGDTDVEWDAKVAERLQRELATNDDVSLPLMTVAQHQRIVAALSAPPAAGVPEEWRDLLRRAREFVDAWDDESQEFMDLCGDIDNALAAPTPPASEQQRAVVMPERKAYPDPEGCSSNPEWWARQHGEAKSWNACLTEFLRLNPHLAKGEGV